MASKAKRQLARAKHRYQKRRARYIKIFNKYRRTSPDMYADFEPMLNELLTLHPKILQQMSLDLRTSGSILPWTGDYHREIIHRVELKIMERTLLK